MSRTPQPHEKRLTPNEVALLIALQEKPRATFSKLAKRLDISVQTVSARYDRLWKARYPESRQLKLPEVYRGIVQADFNTDALGLDLLHVFLHTKGPQRVKTLVKVLGNHPYTLYRGNVYGPYNGIYAQFGIPKGTIPLVEELFDSLVEKGLVDKYEIIEGSSCDSIFTRPNLNNWEASTQSWTFDWNSWVQGFQKLDEPPSLQFPSKKQKLVDHLDMRILRLLTFDVRKKNTDILACLASEDFSQLIAKAKHKKVEEDSEEAHLLELLFDTVYPRDDLKQLKIHPIYVHEVIAPSMVAENIKKPSLQYRKAVEKGEETTAIQAKADELWTYVEGLYPPQRMSERVNRLKKDFIIGHRVFFDDQSFDIYHTIAFRGRCDEETTKKLEQLLVYTPEGWDEDQNSDDLSPFPFQSTFKRLPPNEFFWYIRLPPTHFHKAVELMWTLGVEDFDVLTIDYDSSERYAMFYYTWDYEAEEKAKKKNPEALGPFWKKDHRFMVQEVLDSVEEDLKTLANS